VLFATLNNYQYNTLNGHAEEMACIYTSDEMTFIFSTFGGFNGVDTSVISREFKAKQMSTRLAN